MNWTDALNKDLVALVKKLGTSDYEAIQRELDRPNVKNISFKAIQSQYHRMKRASSSLLSMTRLGWHGGLLTRLSIIPFPAGEMREDDEDGRRKGQVRQEPDGDATDGSVAGSASDASGEVSLYAVRPPAFRL